MMNSKLTAAPSFVSCERTAGEIGSIAYRSLLSEVYTTPKPGLVDRYSNGAHTDMDVHTFEKSAAALQPFFVRAAFEGMTFPGSAEELFLRLRHMGQKAEADMYAATGGVNTHKGLIFTMGLYCAAAGRCLKESPACGLSKEDFEIRLRDVQCEMTGRILAGELALLKESPGGTHGVKNLHKYGTKGIRGEALAGYPALWKFALPVMREGIAAGHPTNAVRLQTLLVLMAVTEDSNILSRRGPQALLWTRYQAHDFLRAGGAYADDAVDKLIAMDRIFTEKNISAGGCADLLAMAIFLTEILGG